MNSVVAYPLQWPIGWKRTSSPTQARFGLHSIAQARDEVSRQVEMLGGRYITISSNLRIRNDGLPYSNQRRPEDCGIAVYFQLRGKPVVLACDAWSDPAHNLWAIAKHIEALRGQERWGVGSVEQAFTGYTALPAPDNKVWWEVLGVEKTSNYEAVKRCFRALALKHHPDKGGDRENWNEIQSAYSEAVSVLA